MAISYFDCLAMRSACAVESSPCNWRSLCSATLSFSDMNIRPVARAYDWSRSSDFSRLILSSSSWRFSHSPVCWALSQRDSRLRSVYSLISVLAKSAASPASVESQVISITRVCGRAFSFRFAAAIPTASSCEEARWEGSDRPRALSQTDRRPGCSSDSGRRSSFSFATVRSMRDSLCSNLICV